MLLSLRIKNFALIDQIELSFDSGFSVITGETGSGKSILLSALNLILGERADFSVIGSKSDKSVVEGEFSLAGYNLNDFFVQNDLDFEDRTIIRREISASGKSRAFINDTPVSLGLLKDLTSQLINIHSQYNTLELKNKAFQLEIVDLLSDLIPRRTAVSKLHKEYLESKNELEAKIRLLNELVQKQDYNQFQLEELETLDLDKRDFLKIESDLNKAKGSGELDEALTSIFNALNGDDQVLDKLSFVKGQFEKYSHIGSDLSSFAERLKSVLIELKDISTEVIDLKESVQMDPEEIDNLSSIISSYYNSLRKHGCRNQEELLEFKAKLEGESTSYQTLDEEIERLKLKVDEIFERLIKEAKELHQLRISNINTISSDLTSILNELKLPNTKLNIVFRERDEVNATGLSDVEFLFSANTGVEAIPVEKAASGGELSRVMLALQKMISEKKLLPSVLFDEVDTGVSGDVAQKIGDLLKKMGENFQLIAISHLPQVAAKANNHFKVEKEVVGEKTISKVVLLSETEKINEVARLMSGETITTAAIEAAKTLMN